MNLSNYESEMFKLLNHSLEINELKNNGQKEIPIESYELMFNQYIDLYKHCDELIGNIIQKNDIICDLEIELKRLGFIK
jgi:hypothetical protein